MGAVDAASVLIACKWGWQQTTCALHTGQVCSFSSHSRMHTSQKMCWQSKVTGVCGLSKHTGQSQDPLSSLCSSSLVL